jgi:membrane carboxypeptidase/penicillin-binding protein PbpC
VSGKVKSVKWYKNGREIKATARLNPQKLSDNKYRLEVNQAEADDAAVYKVVLENDSGRVESSATLKVKLPPEPSLQIRRPLADQQVTELRQTEFEVDVKGRPTEIKWYKNGQELTTNDRMKITADPALGRYRLVIPETKTDDGGNYKIVLSDAEMTVESSAALTVRGNNI